MGEIKRLKFKPTKYDRIFVNNQGEELSRDSIVTNFRRIGQEAGFEKENGCYSFWRSHALWKAEEFYQYHYKQNS